MSKTPLAAMAGMLLAAGPAWASPCSPGKLARGTPLRLEYGPAGLGSIPSSCGADEAAITLDGSALIAIDDFYGVLKVGAAVRGRLRLDDRNWISFGIPGLDYRYSANASVDVATLDVGAGALGWHHRVVARDQLALSPYVRVLVPTESVYRNARRWGFDQGLAVTWQPSALLALSGGTSFPFLAVVSGSRAHTSLVPTATADAVVTPWPPFAAVAGMSLRLRAGRDAGLESFDPRVGLRLHLVGHVELELGAAFPIGGRDRTDVIGGLYVGWVNATARRQPLMTPRGTRRATLRETRAPSITSTTSATSL